MDALVTAITTGIDADLLYGVVTDLVPWLIVIVPVALGLYFIRRAVKGAAKGKVKF